MSFSLRRLSHKSPQSFHLNQAKQTLVHHHIHPFSVTSTSKHAFLAELGLSDYNYGVYNGAWTGNGPEIQTYSPTTNEAIATIKTGTSDDYESCIRAMDDNKRLWASTPAPKRGEIVRTIGEILREKKQALGSLITLENGKILAEGLGEVQEAIDICDFALGLSRSMNGQVIPSERPGHSMLECWNPLNGHVGVITAFNFPVAVAFWNTALSLVCGNTQIWKGASTVPLVTIACGKIIQQGLEYHGFPGSIATVINGSGKDVGSKFGADPRLELLSFTGSTEVGRGVHQEIAARFGKSIMELGGNNGCVIMEDADLDMAVNAVLFSAVGTAGQRCTTLRRVIIHQDVYDEFMAKLLAKYEKVVKIGDPMDDATLCGPLINEASVKDYEDGIKEILESSRSKILFGGNRLPSIGPNFVEPTVVETVYDEAFVQKELFAPVLYVMKCTSFEDAMHQHNAGSIHGLSSSLFTKSNGRAWQWLGPNGSDCGIVNVNIGTSGAEIGGAFGGEKQTGIGRESGSDSWKQYMRRSTC
eukprot:158646_1